jgi:hypothetical protein
LAASVHLLLTAKNRGSLMVGDQFGDQILVCKLKGVAPARLAELGRQRPPLPLRTMWSLSQSSEYPPPLAAVAALATALARSSCAPVHGRAVAASPRDPPFQPDDLGDESIMARQDDVTRIEQRQHVSEQIGLGLLADFVADAVPPERFLQFRRSDRQQPS